LVKNGVKSKYRNSLLKINPKDWIIFWISISVEQQIEFQFCFVIGEEEVGPL